MEQVVFLQPQSPHMATSKWETQHNVHTHPYLPAVITDDADNIRYSCNTRKQRCDDPEQKWKSDDITVDATYQCQSGATKLTNVIHMEALKTKPFRQTEGPQQHLMPVQNLKKLKTPAAWATGRKCILPEKS